jgi:hypothetical protein
MQHINLKHRTMHETCSATTWQAGHLSIQQPKAILHLLGHWYWLAVCAMHASMQVCVIYILAHLRYLLPCRS